MLVNNSINKTNFWNDYDDANQTQFENSNGFLNLKESWLTSILVSLTRTLTAGNGLTGGGDLSADRTFDIGSGNGISVGADSISVNEAQLSTLMPNNKSVIGTFDFNQGWTNGGLTIENGNIFAQTGYFYNISSLSVSTISTNGSLLPSINNTFDIGNQTWLWRDGWFGRTLRVYALSYFFGGVQTTNVTNSNGDLISVPQGMVSFFARESCPKGWTQDSRTTGRYIVGTDNSPAGEVNDTVGTALSDNENRPAGNHTHDITDPTHSHDMRY